jgi:hypothetical protein
LPSTDGLPAPVEGQKPGLVLHELRGHPDDVGVHGKVDQGSPLEREDGGRGVPVGPVLLFGVTGRLARHGVLQLAGDHRDTVEAQHQVQLVAATGVVPELADHREAVLSVERPEVRVLLVAGLEVGEPDLPTVEAEPVSQGLERAPLIHDLADLLDEQGVELVLENRPELLPDLGLGGFDKPDDVLREDGPLWVEVVGAGRLVAVGEEVGFDLGLEGLLGVDSLHDSPSISSASS